LPSPLCVRVTRPVTNGQRIVLVIAITALR
jgi:hypothetical protein